MSIGRRQLITGANDPAGPGLGAAKKPFIAYTPGINGGPSQAPGLPGYPHHPQLGSGGIAYTPGINGGPSQAPGLPDHELPPPHPKPRPDHELPPPHPKPRPDNEPVIPITPAPIRPPLSGLDATLDLLARRAANGFSNNPGAGFSAAAGRSPLMGILLDFVRRQGFYNIQDYIAGTGGLGGPIGPSIPKPKPRPRPSAEAEPPIVINEDPLPPPPIF